MVKLLPSDVARLVLAYLKGHNLKNASQKFLEESPDLEEVRENPDCPILPPLAKDLETILEEHATFIQDGKKRSEVNPVVIQLWRKLDAVVAQLKYEYLQEKLPPPQMKGVNNYLQSQRVRSRLSLNALRSQQKNGRGQTRPGESSTSAYRSRESSDDRVLSRISDQNSSESQDSADTTLTQQVSQESRGMGPDDCQPSTSGTSQRDPVRSPKRKSITPRKKYSPEDLIPMRYPPSQDASTQGSLVYPEELLEFPQILESLLSDQTLPEKLAGTINKVLPNTEFSFQPARATEEPSATTSLRAMDDNSVMDRRALEEVIEMASSDPAFDSLFSLFNVEREKFLEEEKKRLITQTFPESSRDPSVNEGSSVNRQSSCVPRQLFEVELREKQAEHPSKENVDHCAKSQEKRKNGMHSEMSNERQAEISNNRLVECGEEKLIGNGESTHGTKSVEENFSRKDEVSREGDVQGSSDDDDIVEMETETVSTSPFPKGEEVEPDSSYIDVETANISSPSPSKVSSHQPEKEANITGLDKPTPSEGHVPEEEVDVTECKKPDLDKGDMSGRNAAQTLGTTLEKSLPRKTVKEGSSVSQSQVVAQNQEEKEIPKLQKSGQVEKQSSEEEKFDVTEPDRCEPFKEAESTAQRSLRAAQEECLQSEGGTERSNASQNQTVADEKEQIDETAATSDKGQKVRKRRRNRMNYSQGTRRSQRLEAKQKETSISIDSPQSNQGESEESLVKSPAKSNIPLTESDLMDRAKSQNLEAANEYAKKVLASMAHGTSSVSLSKDGPPSVTRHVTLPSGNDKSPSSDNVHDQLGASSVVTSSSGKKCKTMTSLTNTTATVLSTRQNAEITTTKSCSSKGKVTVMAPSTAGSGNGPHRVNETDASCVDVETVSGKSENTISEVGQSQTSMSGSVDAGIRTTIVGSVNMATGSAPPSRVQVANNNSMQGTNGSMPSISSQFIDSNGNIYYATQDNSASTLSRLQGTIRTAYVPPGTSINSMSNAYSTSQTAQTNQHVTAHVFKDASHATQNMHGLQLTTGLSSNVHHISRNQFTPENATQNMQTQQNVVNLPANLVNASSIQYVPSGVQAGGNLSREQYGPGSNTSYSIAGAQSTTLPLLVYNPAALQGTNVVPGSINMQSNSGNQGGMNVVYYSLEGNNNNRTFQLLQSNPGTSGILENPQVITLQAADGLLSLSGAADNTLPITQVGQTHKSSRSKGKRRSSKKKNNQTLQDSIRVNHSNMNESGNVKLAVPLHSSNNLSSAENQAGLQSTPVPQYQGITANISVPCEVQKQSSGLDGSDAIPQRQISNSNHLNLDKQGVETLINEELERSLENASTQDIDFIFKAITMTPQKEPVSSDCAKYSPLDKAVADKLKQFATGVSNQDFSTDVQKGQPSPLKKAAMQMMQSEMLRSKKCVRKVFSDEGNIDEHQPASRTANIASVIEKGNKVIDQSQEKKKYAFEASEIMNGFVPTGTLSMSHKRSNSMPTSILVPSEPVEKIGASENENVRVKSESYESRKGLESHEIRQERNGPKAEERQHMSHRNGMDHYSHGVSSGVQGSSTVNSKCNKDRRKTMAERLKQNNFKYRIDLEKKQKLEKRMRTRLKQENVNMKRDKGIESEEKKRSHKGTDLRTSENAGTSNRGSGEEDAVKFVNDNERVVTGGKGDSDRRVESSAHGGSVSGGIDSGDGSVDRVTYSARERLGLENRRDGDLRKRTESNGKEPNDGRVQGVEGNPLREEDDCGDDLWSRIEKGINDRKWVEEGGKNVEKESSTKVGEIKREQRDSALDQKESCSRTKAYQRTLKRGTPESKVRLDLPEGKVCDDERGHERGKERRTKEQLPNEKEVRGNENSQNMEVREHKRSKSVGHHGGDDGNLGGNFLKDEKVYDSERSRHKGEVREDARTYEQVDDLKVGRSKSCSTPKERTEDMMPVSVCARTEYANSSQGRVQGENSKNCRGQDFVQNGTFVENVERSDNSVAGRFQKQNERRIRQIDEEPDVSPILPDDVSSPEEADSYYEDMDSCSRTRVHYSKTNSRWTKPRPEGAGVTDSNEVKSGGSTYSSSHSHLNRPHQIASTQLNYQMHSVGGHVDKTTTLVNSSSNHSGDHNQASVRRLQASGVGGNGGALAGPSRFGVPGPAGDSGDTLAGPSGIGVPGYSSIPGPLPGSGETLTGSSRVGIPGPSSAVKDKTKNGSAATRKRPSEEDREPIQDIKKRKKKKPISNDDFPSDLDLQKFFAKLKYA